MNKELKQYKTKLGNLSLNEQKLRDLYLRKLSLGEIQGPPTGYASIDKPWLKYFDEEAINKDFEPMSIYQLMEKCNINHNEDTALNYFGNKITYKKLLSKIDKTAKALLELGIKKGETVMMSMPNTPEAEYLFYGLNKIGAIVNSIDPRTSPENIKKDIISSKAEYFFTIDVIYPIISSIAKETNIKKIISISPFISLNPIQKTIMKIKNKKNNDTNNMNDITISWQEFIKLSQKHKEKVEIIYEKNKPAVIIHTGGSTGVPKGVVLSNENFNALIYQQMYSNMGFTRNKTFLNILPPFIALGLNNAMHLSACLGLESILIPTFEPEDFPKLIWQHKPNIVLGGPIHWEMMMNSDLLRNKDLSFLEICCSGGDKMPMEKQRQIQQFLKEHNAVANIWLGYGATETSAGTTCVKNDCYRYESVGAPYLKNILEIYDIETNEMIRGIGQDKRGELRVTGPTLMMEYFDNENETNNAIKKDELGTRWYHTGDIAHFDEDGMLYIDGRIKRIITRRGFKIYPSYVESLIMKHPAVQSCAVVGVPDEEEINIPVANIVLKEGYNTKETKKEVIDYINVTILKELPDYSVMAGYNFLDELPLTPIGKLDFKALEKIGILDNQTKTRQRKFNMN